MKAIIEQVNMYNITIDGVQYKGFEKTGEWEGMIKFKGASGELIVNDREKGFANIFNDIFSPKQAIDESDELPELDIVKATNSLIPEKKPAE